MGDLTHSEISSRGGKSKSPAKLTAVMRNLSAKAALNAKRANAKSHHDERLVKRGRLG
jgi:hypothetical protein